MKLRSVAALALLALPGCPGRCADEIEVVISGESTDNGGAVQFSVDDPLSHFTLEVDCHHATITLHGFPDGAKGWVSLGGEPPFTMYPPNGATHTYLTSAETATVSFQVYIEAADDTVLMNYSALTGVTAESCG